MILAFAVAFLIVAIIVWDVKARRAWVRHHDEMNAARRRIADAIIDANRK